MIEMSTDELLAALGHEIRALRIKRGLSREDLAALTETTARQIGKIERGERGQISEVWRVAMALDTALSWLIAEAETSSTDDGEPGARTLVHATDGGTYVIPAGARLQWGWLKGDDGRQVFDPNPLPHAITNLSDRRGTVQRSGEQVPDAAFDPIDGEDEEAGSPEE